MLSHTPLSLSTAPHKTRAGVDPRRLFELKMSTEWKIGKRIVVIQVTIQPLCRAMKAVQAVVVRPVWEPIVESWFWRPTVAIGRRGDYINKLLKNMKLFFVDG
jgi:hypothetical protein